MKNDVVLRMTRVQALQQGLLICECGHPENNHFDWDTNPCAHCYCKEYREIAKVGDLVEIEQACVVK